MYKKIISPFLFLFDPEKIHTFTFFMIKVFFKIPILGFIIESFYKVESPKLTRTIPFRDLPAAQETPSVRVT